MALGDPQITPSFPRQPSVQDMLLSQATQGAPPSRAMQQAFNLGMIDQAELDASKLTRPNAGVRGLVGGQLTPDEFMQSQRLTGIRPANVATGATLSQTDDLVQQALNRNAPMLGPARPAVTAATGAGGSVAGNVARAAIGSVDDLAAAYGNAYASGLGQTITKPGFMARLKGGLKPNLAGVAWGVGGALGSGLVDQMNLGGEGSTLDNFLTGGIAAGGAGAGIGSMFGPIGTAIGGATGLFAGGIYKALTGDTSNKEERISKAYTGMTSLIQDLGAQYGLDQSTLQNVMLEYDAAARIMMENGDEEGLKELANSMETSLPSTLVQYRLEQEQQKRQNDRMLQIQQQFAPIFQSIVGRSGLNAEAAYTQALTSADALAETNPQLAALVRSNAANTRSSADATMAAYASQAALGMAGNLEEQYAVAANTAPVSL